MTFPNYVVKKIKQKYQIKIEEKYGLNKEHAMRDSTKKPMQKNLDSRKAVGGGEGSIHKHYFLDIYIYTITTCKLGHTFSSRRSFSLSFCWRRCGLSSS